MSYLDFYLSKSLKVKCNGDVELTMYEFLLVDNSNT